MLGNFELFRYKMAGMTNLGLNRVLEHLRREPAKLSLRQLSQIARSKSDYDFIERYKSQEVKAMRELFKQFPSFSILDKVYPERLKEIYNPPVLLFYQGNLDLLKGRKIAFVGSRDASEQGFRAIEKIIPDLKDFTIVSGLARGIDAASHITAVKNQLSTIAVIGTGLDMVYPAEHRALQAYLGEHELILSEYAPHEKALKFHFPERNRIIAGLSVAVVVVEAKLRSGSLITAERAMEEGRDVFAIPGNIIDGRSDGCHHLIQEGAKLVFSAKDILEEYDF